DVSSPICTNPTPPAASTSGGVISISFVSMWLISASGRRPCGCRFFFSVLAGGAGSFAREVCFGSSSLRLITEADEGNLSGSTEHDLSLDPEQQLIHAELRHQIETRLQTLDAEEREVLKRHYFDGERLEDIANALNVSKSWASRLHTRALSRLGKRLQAEPGR
ncbi:MAG TPA: sigma-70 family RNA polymerase sigma factor, partial [Polyangiaceae bacterium]